MTVNMPNNAATRRTASIPGRGDTLPSLTGLTPDGTAISLRDFYMRSNLAILFVNDDSTGAEWLSEAAEMRDAAAEAGEIVAVVPVEMDTHGLPTIVDAGGTQRARLGLAENDLPALFITDRYLTLFAANRGVEVVDDLDPTKIPEWLEFVSCRCS
jgi:hypothetical protein